MAQKKIVQTAGRTQLGEFAPKFAKLLFSSLSWSKFLIYFISAI